MISLWSSDHFELIEIHLFSSINFMSAKCPRAKQAKCEHKAPRLWDKSVKPLGAKRLRMLVQSTKCEGTKRWRLRAQNSRERSKRVATQGLVERHEEMHKTSLYRWMIDYEVVAGILLQSTIWYTEVKQHRPRLVLGLVSVFECQFLLIVFRVRL